MPSGAEPRRICRATERYVFFESEPSPLSTSKPDKDLFNPSGPTGRLETFMLGADLDCMSFDDPSGQHRSAQLPSGATSRSLGVSGIE